MLPHFLSSSRPDTVNVPAPLHFRPIRGNIRNVVLCGPEGYTPKGNTTARQNGLRYEETVLEYFQTLRSSMNASFISGLQLHFIDDYGHRVCIPDGIWTGAKNVIVVEVKLQHMPEAWWQLRRLYQPVVEAWQRRPVHCLEIVKHFDAAMPFPEPIRLVPNEQLAEYLAAPFREFAVHIWKP